MSIIQRLSKLEAHIKQVLPAQVADHELSPEEFLAECERRNIPPKMFLEPNPFELDRDEEKKI